MSAQLLGPVILAAVAAIAAGAIPWSAKPMLSVRALTVVAVAVAATVTAAAGLVVIGFAAHFSLLAPLLEACPVIPAQHQVLAWQGLASIAVLGIGAHRVRRVRHQWRQEVPGTTGERFLVVDDREPVAFAVPGEPGCVVVSRGLLNALSPQERQVVFAHERAHLRLKHHRYLYASALAAAIVPPLAALAARIRTATERSADEAAVEALDGDRRTVAQSIARVALQTRAQGRLHPAFGGGSVPLRVQALIQPGRPGQTVATVAALIAVLAATIGSSAVQLHHLGEVVTHVCGW